MRSRGYVGRGRCRARRRASTRSDGDRAAAYLDEAVDALHANWYQTGFQRVQTVRAVLGDSQLGRQLDGQLTELAAAVPLSGPD